MLSKIRVNKQASVSSKAFSKRKSLQKCSLFMSSLDQKHGISISVSMLAVPCIYCQYSSCTIALWCETALQATGGHVCSPFTPCRWIKAVCSESGSTCCCFQVSPCVFFAAGNEWKSTHEWGSSRCFCVDTWTSSGRRQGKLKLIR